MAIKGSQHSKASIDTKSRVFVKRLLRDAPFCSCGATLSCRNFLQIPMLQRRVMIVRLNITGTATYKADSNKLKNDSKVYTAHRKTAEV